MNDWLQTGAGIPYPVGPVADPVGPMLPRAPVAPVGPVDVDVHPARVRSPISDVSVTVIEPSDAAVYVFPLRV